MGGKVLVSMQEHCDRLVAARLQADIMGTEVSMPIIDSEQWYDGDTALFRQIIDD